jgi:hypothetical protein
MGRACFAGIAGLAVLGLVSFASASAEKGYWQFKGERFVKGRPFLVGPKDPSKVEAAGGGSAVNAVFSQRDFRSVVAFSWTTDSGLGILKPKTKIRFTGRLTHSGNGSANAGISRQPYGQPPGTGHVSSQGILAGFDNTSNRGVEHAADFDVPEGPLYPDKKMELRFEVYPGGAASALYRTYEWIGEGDPLYKDPDSMRAPKQEPKLQPKPEPPDPKPPAPRPKDYGQDARARFNSLTGRVEICMDPNEIDWEGASMRDVLKVGMHIRTDRDSSCIIQFADNNTWVMPPNTEIVIESPPEPETKTGLVLGRLWTNTKLLLLEGRMEIETSQAVAGIKGTMFVCETAAGGDRVAVWRGKVEVTHKKLKSKVMVPAGQAVRIFPEGLGPLETLDLGREIDSWAAYLPADGLREARAAADIPKKSPAAAGWAGTWSTDFNRLVLTQIGNRVKGTYDFKEGRLEGVVEGELLEGTWTQSNGSGRFEFRLNPDGRSFKGRWGYGKSVAQGAWNGTRN